MEPLPVSRRTRLQTWLKLQKSIQDSKQARKEAMKVWQKKKIQSFVNNDGDDEEDIEFLDRNQFEKRVEKASGSDLDHQPHLDQGVDGDNSDDSLQILGDSFNPLIDDVDDVLSDDHDDDGGGDHDDDGGGDDGEVGLGLGVGPTSNVVSLDSDGEETRVLTSEEMISMGLFGDFSDNIKSSGEEFGLTSSKSSSEDCRRVGVYNDNDYDSEDVDEYRIEALVNEVNDGVNYGDYGFNARVKKKPRRRRVCGEKISFEGWALTANPDLETASSIRKRTRSKFRRIFKNKLGKGTVSQPVVIDDDGDGDDEFEEEYDDDYIARVGFRRVESSKRKRGRPRKDRQDEVEDEVKEELYLINKKKGSKLNNHELKRILLNTVTDNGNNASLDDFMTRWSDNYLALKFKFEEIRPSPPPKSLEEEEADELWKELDFALGVCNIASENSCHDHKDHVNLSEGLDSQQKRCANGIHHLMLDEEIGVICKFCSFIKDEIKHVTPEFNKDPFGKSDNTGYGRFLYNGSATSNFILPELIDGQGLVDETTRDTVWDLVPRVKDTLFPHQQEAFEFMWRNISGGIKMEELGKPTKFGLGGCIICHAPGTGKTRLTIVFLQSHMRQYPMSRPVILAPKSVLLTWEEEFRKWKTDIPFLNMGRTKLSSKEDPVVLNLLSKFTRLDLKIIRLAKLCCWQKGRGVLGLSYELFESFAGQRKDTDEEIKQALLNKCGLLVMDEGHRPRNDSSRIWKVLTNVKTKNRIILSGTPFQNNFKELYNTISLVREEFVDPLLAGCYGNYQKKHGWKNKDWRTRTSNTFGDSESHIVQKDARRVEDLRNRIKPFVHVYESQNLIPSALFHSVLILKSSDLQKTCFRKCERLPFLDKDHSVSLTSVHPSLLLSCDQVRGLDIDMDLLRRHKDDLDAGVKIRFLFELIKLSRGERVLIFSQRLPTLFFIGEMLKSQFQWEDDKEVLYMDGKQEDKKRLQSIRLFNDPKSEARVFLASIRACCEGIHLVGASRVVLLDVAWNPFVERQAISRAYRLGQEKDVYVYHLIASDTFEADKYYRQVEKERWSELVFCPSERESATKIKPSSTGKEDRILEEMIRHEKMKNIFKQIIYQPDAQTVIDSICPINFGGDTD